MSRPCTDDHDLSPEACHLCHLCQEDSERGRAYRQLWGEPEPDDALLAAARGHTLLTDDRLRALAGTARLACDLSGDLAEFGVAAGGSAKVLALACPARTLHLFDTWTGIPEDDLAGGHKQGEFAADLALVQQYLAGHRIRYHVGTLPGTFAGQEGLTFSLCHLDLDTYQSTRAAIEYAWPRLVPGGYLVLDDWQWGQCPGVERAVRELLPDIPVEVSASYQARIRKPGAVAVRAGRPAPERLILWQQQSPGDYLTCLAALESLHIQYPGRFLTDLHCIYPELFDHHPYVTRMDRGQGRVIEMHCPDVALSHTPIHFMETWTRYLGEQLGLPLKLQVAHPHLYLSDEEKALPRRPRTWVINAGCKGDCHAKWWGLSRWQAVVDAMPDMTFVQVGESHHVHPPLRGPNVENLVGKMDGRCRPLVQLVSQCDGVLCGVTFLGHVAAALGKPAVVVNLREPPTFTAYPRQTTLSAHGKLPCNLERGCWASRVLPEHDGGRGNLCSLPMTNAAGEATGTCASLISPDDVVRAIRSYYRDGAVIPGPAPSLPAPPPQPAQAPGECAGCTKPPVPLPAAGQRRRPGLLQKAANLARATAQHVAAGLPVLSPAQTEARLAVCRTCSEFDAGRGACNLCGCVMSVKAAWAEQQCPLGKWPT